MLLKNLAIVGNAPTVINYSSLIDNSDIVIRFNDRKSYGGNSGLKTDILFINNTGEPARRYINQTPFKKHNTEPIEYWFPRNIQVHLTHLKKIKAHHPNYANNYIESELDDLTKEIIFSNNLTKCHLMKLPKELNESLFQKLEDIQTHPFLAPSTGSLAIEWAVNNNNFSNYRIHVIGFGFSGWIGHPWAAEKALMADYIYRNKIHYYPV